VSEIRRMPRWPLVLIGAPAAVAVWSGWVSLAGLCGFGVVHPLPGIAGGFTINSAITLPVGVEAYAAFALGAWLRPGTPDRARRFAKFSAIGSLTLGTLGQVAYHLLAAAHATRAPWPVVVLVSSLPVAVLGLASGLAHLLREADEDVPAVVTTPAPAATDGTVSDVPVDVPGDVPADVPEIALVDVPVDEVPTPPVTLPRTVPAKRAPRRPTAGKPKSPERIFAAELAAGTVPSLRAVKDRMHVGTDRARIIRDQLAAMLELPEAA
jgi:hypothetical protein